MKAYIITTGAIFGLITVAHLLRIVREPHVLTEPLFILLTVLSAALCIWAWQVFRRLKQ
ncbi:MAG: hypothetical protein ACRD9S_10035 [Pyrinomonadaceae bacterium]